MATEPLLLIDGDIFLYNACLGAEYEMKWDENTHVLAADFGGALQGFHNQVTYVGHKLGPANIRIAFTKDEGGSLFRHKLYPAYKASRVNKRKPLCFARVRDEIEKTYTCLSKPGLEADDILGIWATRDPNAPTIIVSEDKDLKTVPGKLYRQGQLNEITESLADYWHMFQTLVGDVTDGYSGCPGVGPVKADKILKKAFEICTPSFSVETAWPLVVEAYEKAGLTEDDALVQARLARILRNTEWNALKKEVILWNPPK